jgi:hypothetical protein
LPLPENKGFGYRLRKSCLSKAIAFFVAMGVNQAQGKFLAYVYGCEKNFRYAAFSAISLTPPLLVEANNNHK